MTIEYKTEADEEDSAYVAVPAVTSTTCVRPGSFLV